MITIVMIVLHLLATVLTILDYMSLLFDVFDSILNLKVSCNPGPDGIPSLFIKKCIFTLSPPIYAWKISYIVPIYKAGQRNQVDSYRGLSWMSSSILTEKQHGFRPKRSTWANLIEYYSYLNESFGNRCPVDAIYTDFSKAFDKVNQRILLLKLSHLGFRRETIIWLRSFLCDRWQQENDVSCN
ncbi:uncharacterized protein LOC135135969 [Zophobas morio]|uniref:uncharacterized protein LOC135135969 n=1 Tax=Zophobas morio TaxID=2755281 RepID=UPI003083911D